MRNVGHGARFPMATFGNILPPGSIYSGPTVLQLREDFRIAVGLQTDFGFHTKDSCARESGGLSREDFKGVVELATSPFHLGCTDFCASSSPEDQLCKEWFPRLPSVFALVSRTLWLAAKTTVQCWRSLRGFTFRFNDFFGTLRPGFIFIAP